MRPPDKTAELTPIRRKLREESLVKKNLKRLEKTQKTKTTEDNRTDKLKNKTKSLLTKYILAMPRASQPAPTKEVKIKVGGSPMAEGRGNRVEVVERKGGKEPLGERLDSAAGHQGARRSLRRARLVEAEKVDGSQDSTEKEGGSRSAFL